MNAEVTESGYHPVLLKYFKSISPENKNYYLLYK